MKLKPDYRKLIAVLFFGIAICLLSLVIFTSNIESGRLIWTTFFAISGLSFIAIGLFSTNHYYLNDDGIEFTNLMSFGSKQVCFKDIERIVFIDEEFPAIAHLNNILWLFLKNKKFHRIRRIEIFGINGKIASVDGHFVDEMDYEKLKKKLKLHQRSKPRE